VFGGGWWGVGVWGGGFAGRGVQSDSDPASPSVRRGGLKKSASAPAGLDTL